MRNGLKIAALAGLAAASSNLFAHPGHLGSGFGAGLAHPLSGLDHLLAMLAIGLWAGQSGGRSLWLIPGAFMLAMLGGGIMGFAGVQIPLVEAGLAASVLVLGLMIAFAYKAPLLVGVALAMVFAVFHGHAHGTELAGGISPLGYSAGFLLSTAALHAVGIGCALFVKHAAGEKLVRVSGAAIALCALAMLPGWLA